MASLQETLDVMIEEPRALGLQFCYPQTRMDAPLVPVMVVRVETGYPAYLLTYSRRGLGSNQELVPTDVIWHQPSNMVALVTQRVERDKVRAQGLAAPETEEEVEAFVASKEGQGHWVCVAQAWLPEWTLPSELQRIPELVELANPDSYDLFPDARKHDRTSWVNEGKLDPDKMFLTAKASAYMKRQYLAMQKLTGSIPKEEETEALAESVDELEGAKVKDVVIPIDGPQPKGKIISYPGQDKKSKADPER